MMNPKTIDDAIECVTKDGCQWVRMKSTDGAPYYLVQEEKFKSLFELQNIDNEENCNVKPCPTQAGTFTGYVVEYENEDSVWKILETKDHPNIGIIRSKFNEGILKMAHAFSYEAAMALAWAVKANSFKLIKVRVVPYTIKYSMMAWRKEDCCEVLGDESIMKNS